MTEAGQQAIRLSSCFSCPCPDRGQLRQDERGIFCQTCGRRVTVDAKGIIDLIDRQRLDADAERELREHTCDWTDVEVGKWVLGERAELWKNYYTLDRRQGIQVLAAYLAPFVDNTVCFLGVGTGREIEYLMHFIGLRRVACSDISASNLRAIRPRLAPYPVDVEWLFASDLNNCPVAARDFAIVIVNALHHTGDMHEALDRLLRFGYRDLFLLEPTDNWLIRFFERFGWARRVEYSGVKPGRLDIVRLSAMCGEHGYDVRLRTLWSFPPDYFSRLGIRSLWATRGFLGLVQAVSLATSFFDFGNSSVAHLRRVASERTHEGDA